MANKETWQTAKKIWEKQGQPNLPPDALAQMRKLGWDKGNLGTKLGAFDGAKTLGDKRTAWTPAFEQATKYQNILEKVVHTTKNAKADAELDKKKAKTVTELNKLASTLGEILEDGRAATQDPKPSGRADKIELVAMQNAAGGLRPQWLQVGAIDIKSYLVVDAEVSRLEKAGELGYHWKELQRVCKDTVEKSTDAFEKTILALDGKLQMLSDDDRKAKVREANEVLKHYAGIVEANVNRIVDDYWARALQRQAYLKSFKKECKTDIALSSIAIATSTVSIAMSFGAAALSALVIAKAVLDIAVTIEKLYREADAVKISLKKNIANLEEIYEQRLAAKKSGQGQKASKAMMTVKTAVASALGPISAKMMTTTGRTLKEAKEFLGKLTKAEDNAGKLNKKLAEFSAALPSSPKGPDARTNADMARMHHAMKELSRQYVEFTDALRLDIAWGEACVTLCQNLNDEDYVAKFTSSAATGTKIAISLASLARFSVQLGTAVAAAL